VVSVIVFQAGGGLVIALVMKYADNIIKGFATSLASLISTVASMYLFGFEPNLKFVIGAILVLASAFYYGVIDSKGKQAGKPAVVGANPANSSSSSSSRTPDDRELNPLLSPRKDSAGDASVDP
jgi:hypothetical protein